MKKVMTVAIATVIYVVTMAAETTCRVIHTILDDSAEVVEVLKSLAVRVKHESVAKMFV